MLKAHREKPSKVLLIKNRHEEEKFNKVFYAPGVLQRLMKIDLNKFQLAPILKLMYNAGKTTLAVDEVKFGKYSGVFMLHFPDIAKALEAAKATAAEIEELSWQYVKVFEDDQRLFLTDAVMAHPGNLHMVLRCVDLRFPKVIPAFDSRDADDGGNPTVHGEFQYVRFEVKKLPVVSPPPNNPEAPAGEEAAPKLTPVSFGCGTAPPLGPSPASDALVPNLAIPPPAKKAKKTKQAKEKKNSSKELIVTPTPSGFPDMPAGLYDVNFDDNGDVLMTNKALF